MIGRKWKLTMMCRWSVSHKCVCGITNQITKNSLP